MSRAIKFRAIHKLTLKKWYEEDLVFHNGEWYEDWRAFEDGMPLNLEQCAVLQYTGLKDDYDNELYEGDIVEVHEYLLKRYAVRFIDGCFVFATNYEGACVYNAINVFLEEDCEIIKLGNIYENPELLKGEPE